MSVHQITKRKEREKGEKNSTIEEFDPTKKEQ
jgi:hypothetical protein